MVSQDGVVGFKFVKRDLALVGTIRVTIKTIFLQQRLDVLVELRLGLSLHR